MSLQLHTIKFGPRLQYQHSFLILPGREQYYRGEQILGISNSWWKFSRSDENARQCYQWDESKWYQNCGKHEKTGYTVTGYVYLSNCVGKAQAV